MMGYRKLIAACVGMVCGTVAAYFKCLTPELTAIIAACVGIFSYANSKAKALADAAKKA